jgi:Carboxypeptidase regulatory-like domain/TonB dependent receptor
MKTSVKLLLLSLWIAAPGSAQTFSGTIEGIVKDSSGAVVPGVKVTITDVNTKAVTATVTNNAGNYLASFLNPSEYLATFEKDGFEKTVVEKLTLGMNGALRVDAVLTAGNVQQSITITDTPVDIDKVTPDVGTHIGTDDLINLPESGSEFLIIKIFPGMSGSSPNYSNVNNISMGGGRPVTNPIIIDGLPSNMAADDTYGLVPTPDSTEELQVLTQPFSAQYGQTGGGVLLTTTKAGTTTLHGSMFEYNTNQHFDALDFFSSATTQKPVSIQNYFGVSLGGPVYIPKLYDGRKMKTFFFVDWENTLIAGNALVNQDVATPQELRGDFSGLTPQGTHLTVYDPMSTETVNGKVTRTPFPGDVIPASRLDPVGAKIASYYPTPNCQYQTFNFCVDPSSSHSDPYNADRVDQNIGDFDRLWFRFGSDAPTSYPVTIFNNPANPSTLNGWTDYHGEATWSHIFTAALANELRLGFVQEDNFTTPPVGNVSSLGLQGVPLTQFPSVSVTGDYTLGTSSYQRTRDRHWIINDALNWQKGRHTFQFGGEYMRYLYHNFSPGVLSGNYAFSGTFSSLPGVASTGSGLADLLLGLPATTTIETNNYEFRTLNNYASLYIQDQYKLTSKLTIDLGLRWEFDGPTTELNGQNYSFNPSLVDPTTGRLGAIQFAGINGAPSHFVPDDYKGFLPRVGFAYSLFKNTVLRGGYGIYELPSIGFATIGATSKYSVNATFTSPDGVTPAYELDHGVPAYSYNVGPNGLPNITSSLTDPTANVTLQQLKALIPYTQEWSVSIQQKFGHDWFGEIDYQGNRGVHLPIAVNINQIAPSANCCFGVADAQSLRPYPQFLNVTDYADRGNSNYNALLAKLQHYWRNGISAEFSYTWAKTMDDVDASSRADAVGVQNVYNLQQQYGIAGIDIPQRFTAAFVYSLPFGAGGKFASGIPAVSQVIGHWQVSGLVQMQVGYPYNVSQANTLGLFSAAQYATTVGNPNISPGKRTVQEWFNPAAFAITPQDQLGDTARASFFGPGEDNWDLAIQRSFPIRERLEFKLRVDMFNAFNHPQFDNLNTTITSPAFGSVTSDLGPRRMDVAGRLTW